jgi:uncharacterized protein
MSLLEKIKTDSVQARKFKTPIASFLVTLYSESAKVGKDKRNGESTDEEVILTLRKFKVGAETIIKAATEQQGTRMEEQITQAQSEIAVIMTYLPTMMSEDELTIEILEIVNSLLDKSPKQMGYVMGQLKTNFHGLYDGALASKLVKEILGS